MNLKCQFCPASLEIQPSADFHQQLNHALWTQIDIDMFACGHCARQVLVPLPSDPSLMISDDEKAEIDQSRLDYMEKFYGSK